MPQQEKRYIRLPELQKKVPFSRATFWRLEKDGLFPKRIKIGKKSVAWLVSDIDDWISQKAKRPQNEDQ